ncbi:hypothetical protein BJY59DRAFT_517429 [Rhodotorula toruloides]
MRTGISSTPACWALETSTTMADTPTAGPAPSNPAEPAPSSSTVPQPPPSGEAVTEGELQGGEAAGQPEDEAKTSLEQTGGAADPGAALDTPATASPLPPPPSHSGSATPAPPIVVEPAPTPSTSVSRPSVSSATHSPSPEPDKFAVPYSDAYRAAQSASRWNGLLGWARGVRLESSPGGAERGWDFGTGMCARFRSPPRRPVLCRLLSLCLILQVPRPQKLAILHSRRRARTHRPLPPPAASLSPPSLRPSPTQSRRTVRRRRNGFGGWERVS